MQFLDVSCYYGKVFGAESETSCLNTNGYNRKYWFAIGCKKSQTEVISFQIIGAWEQIANWYLRDILCKLNENELDNHENHN